MYFPEETDVPFFLKLVGMRAAHGICYPMIDRDISSRGILPMPKGKNDNNNTSDRAGVMTDNSHSVSVLETKGMMESVLS